MFTSLKKWFKKKKGGQSKEIKVRISCQFQKRARGLELNKCQMIQIKFVEDDSLVALQFIDIQQRSKPGSKKRLHKNSSSAEPAPS
jgi:hypothetical protein